MAVWKNVPFSIALQEINAELDGSNRVNCAGRQSLCFALRLEKRRGSAITNAARMLGAAHGQKLPEWRR